MPPATRADDKRSVLLLDDDEFLLGIYQLKFEHRGYQVRPFLSGELALNALRAGLAPSAIVVDLALPGIDGFAFLETLAAEHLAPGAPRLILTNHRLKPGDEERARKFGVSRVMQKATVLPNDVVAAVDAAISSSVMTTSKTTPPPPLNSALPHLHADHNP